MRLEVSGLYDYRLESEDSGFRAEFTIERESEDIDILRVAIECDEPAVPPAFHIRWSLPIVDVQAQWHPLSVFCKQLRADWSWPFESYSTCSAPACALFNGNGTNRLTFAFSDALNFIRYDAGVNEEASLFRCYVSMFDTPTAPLSKYEAFLRVDKRAIAYHETLADVGEWWTRFPEHTPAPVPDVALEPMYSTWYSFHQRLTPEEIEEQCRLSYELGCRTVIVDDGWQTSDNARGYAYCGDWEACEEKMPNMRAHVDRVHAMGMKYMLWYTVPFVGIHSRVWERFKDKLLERVDTLGAGVLDPRYPEVREYLIGIYEKALVEWDLDGFKLDFVDMFRQPKTELEGNAAGKDRLSVPEAVDVLLGDVMSRLRAIKPDIMIEFRQNYISPLMRKYGNLFRAADCPNDAVQNRMRTLDIRLLCGDTAVHSDMMMWNSEEPAESAALQIINVLFSVPQISVRLDVIPEAQLEMVKHWLSFMREHRDVLLRGKLEPRHPELDYPLVVAKTDAKWIAAAYSELVVELPGELPSFAAVVNGSHRGRIVFDLPQTIGERQAKVLDCQGRTVSEFVFEGNVGLHALEVPPSGLIVFEALKA